MCSSHYPYAICLFGHNHSISNTDSSINQNEKVSPVLITMTTKTQSVLEWKFWPLDKDWMKPLQKWTQEDKRQISFISTFPLFISNNLLALQHIFPPHIHRVRSVNPSEETKIWMASSTTAAEKVTGEVSGRLAAAAAGTQRALGPTAEALPLLSLLSPVRALLQGVHRTPDK